MITKVYKYDLQIADYATLDLPRGAEILHVASQRRSGGKEAICVWARVNPDEDARERFTIRIAGTGHPLDEEVGRHLGTFTMAGGALVFHAFVAMAPPDQAGG